MKLSDAVSHAGLAFYAEVALIIFLTVFVAVVTWIFVMRRASHYESVSRIPLSDEPVTPRAEARSTNEVSR